MENHTSSCCHPVCSFEGQDIFPYNAGIMLMNMPYMRKTNKKFLNWIVSQRNGLYYPGKCQRLHSAVTREHALPIESNGCVAVGQ